MSNAALDVKAKYSDYDKNVVTTYVYNVIKVFVERAVIVRTLWDQLPWQRFVSLSASNSVDFSVFQILTSTSSATEVVDDGALYKFTFYIFTYF